MDRIEASRRAWFFVLIVAMALITVALFLHPMSPEDFLSLAISDPLQSVLDPQGGNVAIFFWLSTALAALGLSGMLAQSFLFRRLFRHLPRRLLHSPDSDLTALWH
jgi:hypothetical protein